MSRGKYFHFCAHKSAGRVSENKSAIWERVFEINLNCEGKNSEKYLWHEITMQKIHNSCAKLLYRDYFKRTHNTLCFITYKVLWMKIFQNFSYMNSKYPHSHCAYLVSVLIKMSWIYNSVCKLFRIKLKIKC